VEKRLLLLGVAGVFIKHEMLLCTHAWLTFLPQTRRGEGIISLVSANYPKRQQREYHACGQRSRLKNVKESLVKRIGFFSQISAFLEKCFQAIFYHSLLSTCVFLEKNKKQAI
jgi:hypothetical protein